MANLKVYSITSLVKMKSNPHYAEAKRGNLDEAKQLVEDLMEGKYFPIRDEILLPVIAQEAGGRNKIPMALAMYLAYETGNSIEVDIVQAVRANHTGNTAVNRLKNVTFIKQCPQPLTGNTYVIIDDYVTMGGTVSSLAKFIRENGGKVEKVFSLSNTARQVKTKDGTQDITPAKSELQEVKKRFGSWAEEYAEMKYEEMSRPTILQLLKFKTLESLQGRYKNIKASMSLLAKEELDDLWSEFALEYLETLFQK